MKHRWSASLPDAVAHAAFAPDGSQLAVASLSGLVAVLDATSGAIDWRVTHHAGGALAAAFSPDGRLLVTGGENGRVEVFDVATRARSFAVETGAWVTHLVWSGDGAVLAIAAGRTVRFCDARGAALGEAAQHASTITSLFWHPVLGFASSCYGGVQFLAPGKSQPVRRLPFRGSVLRALPSPDGRLVAGGNQDSSVHVWGQRHIVDADLRGYPGKVRVLAWSEHGPMLATGGGNAVVIWPCDGRGPMGRTPLRLEHHEARVSGIRFIAGGRRFVSVGEDGRVCMWGDDPERGFAVVDEARASAALRAVEVDAAETVVVAAAAGGALEAWDLIAARLDRE